MADGGMTIQIDEPLATVLRAEAGAAGISVDDYVRDLLTSPAGGPFDDGGRDPAIDVRIAEAALATGAYVTLEEFEQRMKDFGKPR